MGLLVAAVIMFVISIGMFAQKARYSGREVPRAVAIVPLLIGIVLVLASMVAIIPAGHVGVPILFGKVQDNPLTEGLHLINPLLEVQNMSVRTEAYTMSSVSREGQLSGDDSITVLSKDGLRMPLDITVQYRLLASDAPAVYRTLGLDYVEKVIRPAARTSIREAASQFAAQEAYSTRRSELQAAAQDSLARSISGLMAKQEGFSGDGFVIQQLLLRSVTLPKRLQVAIEDKLSAEQDAQRMEFVLAKEIKEAERKKIEAAGIAEFQKIVTTGISELLLKWKGIEATMEIAKSPNAKVVIIGGKNGLPIILNVSKE